MTTNNRICQACIYKWKVLRWEVVNAIINKAEGFRSPIQFLSLLPWHWRIICILYLNRSHEGVSYVKSFILEVRKFYQNEYQIEG